MAKKLRLHREWFRPVAAGGRKSCPGCSAKLPPGERVWSWGQYVAGKWRTVRHFCVTCYPTIQKLLVEHAAGCGCEFELVSYQGATLPTWLTSCATGAAFASRS